MTAFLALLRGAGGEISVSTVFTDCRLVLVSVLASSTGSTHGKTSSGADVATSTVAAAREPSHVGVGPSNTVGAGRMAIAGILTDCTRHASGSTSRAGELAETAGVAANVAS